MTASTSYRYTVTARYTDALGRAAVATTPTTRQDCLADARRLARQYSQTVVVMAHADTFAAVSPNGSVTMLGA